MGRATAGVDAIRLAKGDQVVSMDAVRPDSKASLLVLTEKGIGKRTPISQFPRQGRAGQGVRLLTIIPKGGQVCTARVVYPEDDLVVISTSGQVIRMFVDGIPHKGRPAQGVAVMNMRDKDSVASVALIPRTDKGGKMLGDADLEVLSEANLDGEYFDDEGDGDGNGSGYEEAEAIAKMPKVVDKSAGNGAKTRPTKAASTPAAEVAPAVASKPRGKSK
jgi:DNA gyrase subunit A